MLLQSIIRKSFPTIFVVIGKGSIMAKKRRRNNPHHGGKARSKPRVVQQFSIEGGMKAGAAQPLSEEDQKMATTRMADLFREISKAPEGFIPWLNRMEIPHQIGTYGMLWDSEFSTLTENSDRQYLLIAMIDLIDGEERNQEQGSILSRLSNKRIDERLPIKFTRPEGLSNEVWDRITGEK